jgi:hypothetical protein
MSDISESNQINQSYYQLNKKKILEQITNKRNTDRPKYNNYMKDLTKKLSENIEWKKKRLEQKRLIAAKSRLLKRGDEPMKKRGRKPKIIENITLEIIV